MKGAFTDAKSDRVGRFELAEGSTLFLDEIANVPLSQQQKLLRVIETGEFERLGSSKTRKANVRLISATNADLNAEVAAGRFRQDLLFRLNTIEVHLPPLRDRREDIPLLSRHFLRQHAQRYRKNVAGFDPAAMQMLLEHRWPGNVRELDHSVERAVLMSQGNTIRSSDLGLKSDGTSTARLEDMSLEDVEAFLIKKAMGRYGNVSQAARALGLSRSALYRRLERYKL
jgi:DNA-binding NtrC family response regulator